MLLLFAGCFVIWLVLFVLYMKHSISWIVVVPLYAILLIFMWDNCHLLYKSKNQPRHLDSTATYAHFSAIDKENLLVFPRLSLASPVDLILKSGDCLYIPAGWWHWIKTTQPTHAVNFWWSKDEKADGTIPYRFKYSGKTVDWKPLINEPVTVWQSDGMSQTRQTTLGEFLGSKKNNEYVITLADFNAGNANVGLKQKLRNQITVPQFLKETNVDFNVWISNGKHDTGLHYDDESGVLCVLEGEKQVTLYPPSDTPFLYAYDVEYKWLNTVPVQCRYNSFFFSGKELRGKPSSHLLYETCRHLPCVLAMISKLHKQNAPHRLVWGYKKYADHVQWEIYKYDLAENPCVQSWDLFIEKPNLGEQTHFYYALHGGEKQLPFWGRGTKKTKGKAEEEEAKIFVLDTYDSFARNYAKHMKRLGYESISEKFKDTILQKFTCYELCIHNKTCNQIYVQYLGIAMEEFIQFLYSQNYDKNLVQHVVENKKNYEINFEITVVYDIETQQILRSAFYGNL